MSSLLHHLIQHTAERTPQAVAIKHRDGTQSYAQLCDASQRFAALLPSLGLQKHDRVAIFLPKQPETVAAMFGTAAAGCAFVPVNSVLKPAQVEHILRDCSARALVTSSERLAGLANALTNCPDLRHVVLVDETEASTALQNVSISHWRDVQSSGTPYRPHRVIDVDMTSIFYTSGSTGKPKGVVLSHRNMVVGADSVAQYLENTPSDKLLAVLPFSFDYGFSQLSTAFQVGASVVLLDHLFARDVINTAAREQITGIAGVPPLWSQLADLPWPDAAKHSLRYFTNSGGTMPIATLQKLRASLPRTSPFLMYGLTEAFRSTYLPPAEIDRKPGSIGKAIPNAEVLVLRPDGTACVPHEAGELVHRGSLVAAGYWNDPVKTAKRFRPIPNHNPALQLTEFAVWSGDLVKMDEDGYLYFVGRNDDMIKTSGYRVSPSEIEAVVFATGLVTDAVALGVAHPTLGQAIAVVVVANAGNADATVAILEECKRQLPTFMVPTHIERRDSLPRNPNGKYDRTRLATELATLFGAGVK